MTPSPMMTILEEFRTQFGPTQTRLSMRISPAPCVSSLVVAPTSVRLAAE